MTVEEASEKFPKWCRTCTECGHVQMAREPDHSKELTRSYRDAKCRKCHSSALDYGTMEPRDETCTCCKHGEHEVPLGLAESCDCPCHGGVAA